MPATCDTANGSFTQEYPKRDQNNRYSYCGGDPVNHVDPTGEAFFKKLWNGIKTVASKAVSAVVRIVKTVGKAITSTVGKAVSAVTATPKTTTTRTKSNVATPTPVPQVAVPAQNNVSNLIHTPSSDATVLKTYTDLLSIPTSFKGIPNSIQDFPEGGGYSHFGENGYKDYDYNTRNHNPKYHPSDENGGHYHDWDYTDPEHPRHSAPYVYDDDGNRVYDPNYKKQKENDTPLEEKNSILTDFIVCFTAIGMLAITIVRILAIAGLCAV